jgi:hypothetical protein
MHGQDSTLNTLNSHDDQWIERDEDEEDEDENENDGMGTRQERE